MRGLLGDPDLRARGHAGNGLNVLYQGVDILVDVVSEDQLNVKSGESYRPLESDPRPGEFEQSKADTLACRFIGSERVEVTCCSACAAGASAKLITPTTAIAACLFKSLKSMPISPSVVDRMVRRGLSPQQPIQSR
jgi:hypothetical protein